MEAQFDKVDVKLIKVKKGLVFKHVEYTVLSQLNSSEVERRYSDFLALYELIKEKYPYRLVPNLPPQKITAKIAGLESNTLEKRHKGLKRWLSLLVSHPVISKDQLIHYFLTYPGSDLSHNIRKQFKSLPDEFITSSEHNEISDGGLMSSTTAQGQVAAFAKAIHLLIDVFKRQVERSLERGEDMKLISDELKSLSGDVTLSTVPTTPTDSPVYGKLLKSFGPLSSAFASLSVLWPDHARKYNEDVVETLNVLLDTVKSHKELCSRSDPKCIALDHKKAMEKVQNIKIRKLSGIFATDPTLFDKIENRISEREATLRDPECRTKFSLYCLTKETEIVFHYTSKYRIPLKFDVG